MYGTTDELFRVLKVRTPTADQTAAAERCLNTATVEIDSELDRPSTAAAFTTEQEDLVTSVAIDRAADLWRHTESAPGILGVVEEAPISDSVRYGYARYSWERYAQRLAPLKQQWGLA